jgi:tRNA A37 methylthiotransferase MiaB
MTVLGCMAERLKHQLLEKEEIVDIIAGPDSYKDLPRLLSLTDSKQTAVNVLHSLEETYADIVPVRLNQDSVTGFVSDK